MMMGESGDERASSVSMKSNHAASDDQDFFLILRVWNHVAIDKSCLVCLGLGCTDLQGLCRVFKTLMLAWE